VNHAMEILITPKEFFYVHALIRIKNPRMYLGPGCIFS
jgi:hypothetical protein